MEVEGHVGGTKWNFGTERLTEGTGSVAGDTVMGVGGSRIHRDGR